jgi:ELWxxDGT repeat protein
MVAARLASRPCLAPSLAFALALALALAGAAAADTAEQVFDLNPGLPRGVNNVVHDAAAFNGLLWFAGQSGTNDVELWRYDGTSPPVEHADLNPSGSSDPGEPTVFGSRLCFSAQDATFVRKLYCFEGSDAPAVVPIGTNGSPTPMNFLAFGSFLYFTANGDAAGQELWRWNGTDPPERVSDIAPGPPDTIQEDSFGLDAYDDLVLFDGALHFAADDGTGDRELYRYDGVAAPVQVTDAAGQALGDTLVGADALYFVHSDAGGQGRLWRYDGTNPPAQVSATLDVEGDLMRFAGKLHFFALETEPGSETSRELWRYDGSSLTRIAPGHVFEPGSGSWQEFAGSLYFVDVPNLLRYNGSSPPDLAVDDFDLPADIVLNGFEAFQNRLYFAARHDTDGGGEELWRLEAAPATGSAAFSPAAYSFGEGTLSSVAVVRTGDTSGTLTVQLQTVDGDAIAFADYLPKIETLTWGPGDTTPRQPLLDILPDVEHEWLESFTLELYQPFVEAGQLVSTATITIVDDDPPPGGGDPAEVPALDTLGLLALAGLLGAAAFAFLRRG